jgi:hypothetical protein
MSSTHSSQHLTDVYGSFSGSSNGSVYSSFNGSAYGSFKMSSGSMNSLSPSGCIWLIVAAATLTQFKSYLLMKIIAMLLLLPTSLIDVGGGGGGGGGDG